MRLKLGVCALAVAALAACGRAGDVSVEFKGSTPTNALAMKNDPRSVTFHCPACGATVNADAKICSKKVCGAKVVWEKDRQCAYCAGTGDCNACRLMGTKGECYNCRGNGYLTMQGKTPACPNCKTGEGTKGSGKCAACSKNPGRCDFCEGKGLISIGTLKTKQPKAPAESP